MLRRSKCFQRRCKWFKGIKQDNKDERTERYVCQAFPDGIPGEVSWGDNLHSKVLRGQQGSYVYEKTEGDE